VACRLTLYTVNRRLVAKFKECYEDLGKSDWVE